jgi:glycosyltransferase involved in cell wall biosynthesis
LDQARKYQGSGITVKGFVKKEELAYLYRNASIFVMPSIFEPFGHVFLEAIAYKTPCIGCGKDAMPEIIKEGKIRVCGPYAGSYKAR